MAPNNPLPCHGNEKTMNLNTMILTNIQQSPYFKVQLFDCKTYHEVIDEIYNKVSHLEPWEKGSYKTAGQTGMCGGVRGVGAGGIVSSCFCLLYKLFTLKLTSKQAVGLMNHADSPYIRALGFMYIRYTQNPAELWDWFEHYIEDEEEIDVKAGGGHVMTIGAMLRQWLTKLEWYGTLFPRIPVPIQKQINEKLAAYEAEARKKGGGDGGGATSSGGGGGRDERYRDDDRRAQTSSTDRGHHDRNRHDDGKNGRAGSSPVRRRSRSRSRDRHERRRSRSPRGDRRRSRSRERGSGGRQRETSFERDLRREKERQSARHADSGSSSRRRSRSRSRDRRR